QDLAFERMQLSVAHLNALDARARRAALAPRIDVTLALANGAYLARAMARITETLDVDVARAAPQLGVYVQATWFLADAFYREVHLNRTGLYDLRREVGFEIDDAWHERRLHLEALAQGRGGDAYQQAVRRVRIEVLEAIIRTWLGRPMLGAERP